MIITANNPIENLGYTFPKIQISQYKIFHLAFLLPRDDMITIGSRIGDFAIDLGLFINWVILMESH